MPQITARAQNDTSDNQIVHVYDQFANGRREVGGSPFALAKDEVSPDFSVNADAEFKGVLAYACEGGPSKIDNPIQDGGTLPID